MNPNCRDYALPSLCFSILPICRTPEQSNHKYFAMKAIRESQMRPNKSSRRSKSDRKSKYKKEMNLIETTITPLYAETSSHRSFTNLATSPNKLNENFDREKRDIEIMVDAKTKNVKHFVQPPTNDKILSIEDNKRKEYELPTRESENLRRICRDECELLENELCQKEYAIAKRHPTIGKQLQLEDCETLPMVDDCSRMGIKTDVNSEENCFWETGSTYRGTKDISVSGLPCIKWAKIVKEISNHPELAGHNYCR